MPPVQVFAEGMGRLLEAISVTSSIIKALQQHFAKVVAPHMEDAPAEGATCAAGLAALVHAVEDRVLACLQGGLNALFGQVSRLDTGCSDRCMLSDRLWVLLNLPVAPQRLPGGLNACGQMHEMADRGVAAAHADQLLNAAAGSGAMHPMPCCWGSLPACSSIFLQPQRLCCGLQLDRTLTSDQKRLDFRPPEDLAPPLDHPTEACQLATALLAALSSSAPQTLQGSNLTAFNGEARGPPHCWLAACNPRLVSSGLPERGPVLPIKAHLVRQ